MQQESWAYFVIVHAPDAPAVTVRCKWTHPGLKRCGWAIRTREIISPLPNKIYRKQGGGPFRANSCYTSFFWNLHYLIWTCLYLTGITAHLEPWTCSSCPTEVSDQLFMTFAFSFSATELSFFRIEKEQMCIWSSSQTACKTPMKTNVKENHSLVLTRIMQHGLQNTSSTFPLNGPHVCALNVQNALNLQSCSIATKAECHVNDLLVRTFSNQTHKSLVAKEANKRLMNILSTWPLVANEYLMGICCRLIHHTPRTT